MLINYLRKEFIKSSYNDAAVRSQNPNINESVEGRHVDSLQQQQF
jgi:hypothetical protein